MDEKKEIERATAEAFLRHYNHAEATSYRVVEHQDAPDIIAKDDQGQVLRLEIVLTEDRRGDIQSSLGRSDVRSVDALKRHLQEVRDGTADPLNRISALSGNVTASLVRRLCAKFKKRYGPNTALVVRDTSGVDWDWDFAVADIRRELHGVANPFNRGVWILNRSKDRLFRVA